MMALKPPDEGAVGEHHVGAEVQPGPVAAAQGPAAQPLRRLVKDDGRPGLGRGDGAHETGDAATDDMNGPIRSLHQASHCSRKLSRARWSPDFTVPSAVPSTTAVSRSDRSST